MNWLSRNNHWLFLLVCAMNVANAAINFAIHNNVAAVIWIFAAVMWFLSYRSAAKLNALRH